MYVCRGPTPHPSPPLSSFFPPLTTVLPLSSFAQAVPLLNYTVLNPPPLPSFPHSSLPRGQMENLWKGGRGKLRSTNRKVGSSFGSNVKSTISTVKTVKLNKLYDCTCSCPKDGLRCRRGVKPPLQTETQQADLSWMKGHMFHSVWLEPLTGSRLQQWATASLTKYKRGLLPHH